ncbi:MAG: hypothetical protein IGS54_15215 [Elainella sp. C42_A2020_010]|nr:hypothetical protein [Elainella sp. C42_A2020_010]RNJ64876.1 MAG: hypothetical protein EDM05_34245 [Leptolyngbya sp. IPPAS B-1204]
MYSNNFKIKTQTFPTMPLLSLGLLWLSYALVGWQLSVYYIFLFIGILIAVAAVAFAWSSTPWFEGLFGYLPQVLLIALTISILTALIAIFPMLVPLMVIPMLTTLLAWQEIQALTMRKRYLWSVLITVAIIGLGIGEYVDLFILPSEKGM